MDRPIIILGGGLWGSLLAYRLSQIAPQLDFLLYEKGQRLGGQHTWSFFGSDLSMQNFQWIKPLIKKSWGQYSVAFPKFERTLITSYHSITSDKLHEVVTSEVPVSQLKLGEELTLDEALKLGSLVIDARGIFQTPACGYQKFLGLKIKTSSPHGLRFPLIMDATVEQKEGFRFFYFLPWSEDTLLVEDTRYTLKGTIDRDAFLADIHQEISKRGWSVARILEEEWGSLPIPLSPVRIEEQERVINLAGFFHDTTGYSLPLAVSLIEKLTKLDHFEESQVRKAVQDFRATYAGQRTFYRLLNQLLFKAASPEKSYRMLEFFYTHRQDLIERFYAGELSLLDKVRFFMGKPPVSIPEALGSFLKRSSHEF